MYECLHPQNYITYPGHFQGIGETIEPMDIYISTNRFVVIFFLNVINMSTIKNFPDNFKCVLWNNRCYFTHFFNSYTEFGGKLNLEYLSVYTEDIGGRGARWKSSRILEDPGDDIRELVKIHFNQHTSYKNLDFSEDKFKEIPFVDLPPEVKTLFREFEKLKDFKISKRVCNHFNNY